jgi:hypothetical protein
MVGTVVDAKRMSPPNSFEAAMMLRVVSADVKLKGDAFDEETANVQRLLLSRHHKFRRP